MLTSPSVRLCERSLLDGDDTNDTDGGKRSLGKTALFVAAAIETLGNGAPTDSSVTGVTALSILAERITGRVIRTKMEGEGTAVKVIRHVSHIKLSIQY